MTITARCAQVAADRLAVHPRQLERWWGPPTYPASVVDHDLTAGGRLTYFMTGPEGDQARGWWRVLAVEAPRRLEFEDGFADDAGNPNLDLPTTTTRVTLDERATGGTFRIISVATVVGWTLFTRMRSGAHSFAITFIIPMRPALAAE